ncbi:MAG: alpha/beta fold hydrolase, partial [Polyangiaceae bacterium]
VVMEWANNYPGELAGIVVGCSSARDLATRFQRFSPRGVLAIGMNRFLTRDPMKREARMVRLLSHGRGHYERTVKLWGDIAVARPIPQRTIRSQVIAALRWRAPSNLKTPALFLVGSKDRLVDPECTHALATRFGTKAVVHDAAGHDLTTDQPGWCASQMFSFQKNVLEHKTTI